MSLKRFLIWSLGGPVVFILSKNGIYMYACLKVIETCSKNMDMILRYLLISLIFNFIKNATI